MRQKSIAPKSGAEQVVRDIRRQTRKQYSAEEKIRVVLSGLRGEGSIALSEGCFTVPGHQAPLLGDYVKGALTGDLRWSEGLCASLYGLWVETQACPSCSTSAAYPTGGIWLEAARFDQRHLWSVPPIEPTALDPNSIDDLTRAIKPLPCPAHLTRDHLGIGAHCPAFGCVLPRSQKDWRFASGYLLPLTVSEPTKPRGWWTWQGWPQAVTDQFDPATAELMWNYL